MSIAAFPREPAVHLRLALLGAGVSIAERIGDAAPECLGEYAAEVATLAGKPLSAAQWDALLAGWSDPTMPLERLRGAVGDPLAIDLLLAVGLVGEDPRIATLLGDADRLTLATLTALWRSYAGRDDPAAVRRAINRLLQIGLVTIDNPDAPRFDWRLAVSAAAWDALSGETQAPPGCRLIPLAELPLLDDFIAPEAALDRARLLAEAMAEDEMLVPVLRGPERNGRTTLAGALARRMGRPLLVTTVDPLVSAEGWARIGLFAFLHDAVVALAMPVGPGEVREVPGFALDPVRLIVITGTSGGIRLADRPQATLAVPAPECRERQAHWQAALPQIEPAGALALAGAFRLTGGTIRRAAIGAALTTRQAGRATIARADVRTALRDLQDSRLETVAARIDAGDRPEFLTLDEMGQEELDALATRCRNREALGAHAGSGAGATGVRALFAGPSGAGKTLAARRLAHDLARDIWRIDLAATVSKYIGETEKALDRAFAAAEELDTILLLDEGDALMARRTDVSNANDRYANLETNFLLQRIETFSGILIVTTNAPDRIDKAFQRRMDVVVPFRAPDELRRYEILEHHLGEHRAADELVQEIAVRCALSGGQLRNVALHARLLALDAGVTIGDEMLRRAVFREYRKLDAHCPLKPQLSAVG
ncbi:ATP-binding protein [Sphingomonas sp. LM7]|uniref:ATP-binding protein n=1 Tax=Sphingomonas sp. LM7 TaxID=1938607 RepID=UPI0009838D23|nr:ATP-binding protein [Sphingomonas sp. LM7]AQR73128.1 hypothetical protein BXU08_05055 [Sphingomonas sp. LM7]